jgi:HEAT repeat protein
MNPLSRLSCTISIAAALMVAGCDGGGSTKKIDVPAQISALKGDHAAKENALIELAEAGPKAAPAVNDLIPILKDPDPVIRRLAIYALGQIGPAAKAAIPALKEGMGDTDRNILTATVNALRDIQPKEVDGVKVKNTME